jgi:excisionase family DNA binding protein
MQTPDDPILFKPVEATAKLGVGLTTVKALIRSGELESVRIGRCRRIPAEALEEYVSRLRAASRVGA